MKSNGQMFSALAAAWVALCASVGAAATSPVTVKFADGDAVYYPNYNEATRHWDLYSGDSLDEQTLVLPPTQLYADESRETPYSLDDATGEKSPGGKTLYALPENFNPAADGVFTVVHRGATALDAYRYTSFNVIYDLCTTGTVRHVSDCVFTFRGLTFKPEELFNGTTWPRHTLFSEGFTEFSGENRWTSNLFAFVECDFTAMPTNNAGWGIMRPDNVDLPPGIQLSFKDCPMSSAPLQFCKDYVLHGATIDLTMDGCDILGYPGSDSSGWGDVLVTNCTYRNLLYWHEDEQKYMYGRIYLNGHVRDGYKPAFNAYGQPDRKVVTDCVVLDGIIPGNSGRVVSVQNTSHFEIGTIWADEKRTVPLLLHYAVSDENTGKLVTEECDSDSGIAYEATSDSQRLYVKGYLAEVWKTVTLALPEGNLMLEAICGLPNLFYRERNEAGQVVTIYEIPWPEAVYTDSEFKTPYDTTSPIPYRDDLVFYVKVTTEGQGGAAYIDKSADSPLATVGFGADPSDASRFDMVAKPMLLPGVDFGDWTENTRQAGKFKLIVGTELSLFTLENLEAVVKGGIVEGLTVQDLSEVAVLDGEFLKFKIQKSDGVLRCFYRLWIVE